MSEVSISLWRRLNYTRLRDAVRGRWDASLDWRLAVADASLPAEIEDVIGGVIGRTRLWRREKVDVAREMVAHFQDGLDAGRTPEQLIQSFGDPQQAARLIRRAKKRGRPLVWHVWCYGLWTVWMAIALYALSAICLLVRQPIASIDYLSGLNADARNVAPDERAWPLYRRALLDLDCQLHTADGKPPRSAVAQEARPGDAKWPDAVAFLNAHQARLARLREAAALPHLGYELGFTIAPEDQPLLGGGTPRAATNVMHDEPGASHPPLFDVLLPHLDALRAGVRLLEADVYRAVDEGDAATAYADVVALLGVSRQLGETPFMIGGLVALAVEGVAGHAVEHVMTVEPTLWSDRELVDLAHRLGGRRYDVMTRLTSERIAMHDIIQRLYTDDGHGDGTITYAGLKQLVEWEDYSESQDPKTNDRIAQTNRLLAVGMPIAAGVVVSRAELEEEFDKLFALAAADVQTPLWERPDRMMDEFQRLRRTTWSQFKYAPIMVILPAIDSFRLRIDREHGRAEGVMIGLALELYHREHGRWPESLDGLSPRWLPTVPVDRINGGPLGYRIVDDRPIVYSLGNDTDDDGGRLPDSCFRETCTGGICPYDVQGPNSHAEDGDWVIWSTVPEEGGVEDGPAR